MTQRERRALESNLLRRIRRELADVPVETHIRFEGQTYSWTGQHINSLIAVHPEEEWTRIFYTHLTVKRLERIIAAFRRTLTSSKNRAEDRRLDALKHWAES